MSCLLLVLQAQTTLQHPNTSKIDVRLLKEQKNIFVVCAGVMLLVMVLAVVVVVLCRLMCVCVCGMSVYSCAYVKVSGVGVGVRRDQKLILTDFLYYSQSYFLRQDLSMEPGVYRTS